MLSRSLPLPNSTEHFLSILEFLSAWSPFYMEKIELKCTFWYKCKRKKKNKPHTSLTHISYDWNSPGTGSYHSKEPVLTCTSQLLLTDLFACLNYLLTEQILPCALSEKDKLQS